MKMILMAAPLLAVLISIGSGARAEGNGLPVLDTASPSLYGEQEFTSIGDRDGDILILHFWASYCAPCVRELPEYQAFLDTEYYAGLQKIGLQAVAISEDFDYPTASRFLTRRININIPAIIDHNNQIIHQITGAESFPLPLTALVRKRDGVILRVHEGVFDWSPQAIEKFLQLSAGE